MNDCLTLCQIDEYYMLRGDLRNLAEFRLKEGISLSLN